MVSTCPWQQHLLLYSLPLFINSLLPQFILPSLSSVYCLLSVASRMINVIALAIFHSPLCMPLLHLHNISLHPLPPPWPGFLCSSTENNRDMYNYGTTKALIVQGQSEAKKRVFLFLSVFIIAGFFSKCTGVMAIGIYCIINPEIHKAGRGSMGKRATMEVCSIQTLLIDMHPMLLLPQMFSLPTSSWFTSQDRRYQRDLLSMMKQQNTRS